MTKTILFVPTLLVFTWSLFAKQTQKIHHGSGRTNIKWDTTNKKVVASDDGNFRIYWWDTKLGGTMVKYKAFAKYNTGSGVKMKMLSGEDEKDYGCAYKTIYTIKRADNKMVYLVLTTAATGVDDIPEDINAYTIENGVLQDTIKIFKTAKKSYNSIGIDYDWQSADNEETIHLTADKKKLYIPVIENDLKYTGKFLVYIFDGYHFVFDKNAK